MNRKVLLVVLSLLVLPILVVAEDERPLILVSNDDGIESEALKILAIELTRLGEVAVAAPKHNSSGVGHGITYRVPITYGRYDGIPGVTAWWVEALPATCVRWAIDTCLGGRKPNLVVSGINDGVNIGVGVYYSGTVGAAREGAFSSTVAIAASMDRGEVMDYAGAAARIRQIAARVLELERRPLLLNVNFPMGIIDESRQVSVTRLADIRWDAIYHDRESPRGGRYFWITYASSQKPEEGSDAAALADGMISITPLIVKATDEALMQDVREAIEHD